MFDNQADRDRRPQPRRRQTITVEVSRYELRVLIAALESRAQLALGKPETIDTYDAYSVASVNETMANHWFDRAAELRRAADSHVGPADHGWLP